MCGDGRIFAGGVENEVGDLVESALLHADVDQESAEGAHRVGHVGRRPQFEGAVVRDVGLFELSCQKQPRRLPGGHDAIARTAD